MLLSLVIDNLNYSFQKLSLKLETALEKDVCNHSAIHLLLLSFKESRHFELNIDAFFEDKYLLVLFSIPQNQTWFHI